MDALPVSEVHEWALEKHERLRRYIDAAHGARGKFSSRCYVDLYSGPGRALVVETGQEIDGSPLVAFDAAARQGDQFTEFLIADINEDYVRAAERRLTEKGAKVRAFVGPAHRVVEGIAAALDPRGLHLAFLDPYNLGDLPFSVIRRLASFKHMDLLIHVSSMDLKRELHHYLQPEGRKALDEFAPGWREHVDTKQRQDLIRRQIYEHWCGLLKGLGTSASDRVEAVDNSKHANLYWLVFVARHRLAHKLWEAVANVSPQRRLI
ncbi:MAG: three-Cys-motif partner protein TcmP [Betaproteobacteria bacterium]|nr:three-Cys-motif partner protein TcmP [Betaproteobacteria bacterium]